MSNRRREGQYIDLYWDYRPGFYAVRGHVDLGQAAATVNAAAGAEFTAADFHHGWLKLRFSERSHEGPLWFVAAERERPNIPVTLTEVLA